MFNNRTMYRIFSLISFVFVVAVVVRLFILQVIQYGFYDSLVDTQSSTKSIFTTDRGLILDRDGKSIVQNRKVASLYTFGKNIDDPSSFMRALQANGININKSAQDTIAKKGGFVWLSRREDIKKAEKIKQNIPGVYYRYEDARFYPEGRMLAGILGITGVDNQGLEGIEYYANDMLVGHTVPVRTQKDARGKLILYDDSIINTQPDSAVYLTIQLQMQATAEQVLKEDLQAFGARRGIALAIEVATGNIIVAAYTRDPAQRSDYMENRNYISSYLFEPGSIYKAVTFAHLIEAGRYRADEKINTEKVIELYGHQIKDVTTHSVLTQKEIFTKSSNIGTVSLATRLPRDGFYNFMHTAGFGIKLGVDGMTEESGVLREPKRWSGLSQASLSIGQEILVTPLQIVRYYAAIANKGLAITPRIIDHYNVSGRDFYIEQKIERLMSANTATTLLEMMEDVVNTGTGKKANSSLVKIGGKTGTGQIFDRATNAYSKVDYTATFAGVFPVEDPKIAMVVIYESPRKSIYGGNTGAVTFKKLADQIAFFYNLGTNQMGVQYAGQ